ncbi:MAG: hypothetical protein ACI4XO_02125 [Akkermansia sp.]
MLSIIFIASVLFFIALLVYLTRHGKVSKFAGLIACLVSSLTLVSCSDEPCPIYNAHKQAIAQQVQVVNDLDAIDFFLQGAGLSNKVADSCKKLQEEVVAFRSHLQSCSSGFCRKRAEEEIGECNEVISKMEDAKDMCSVFDLLRVILIFFGI